MLESMAEDVVLVGTLEELRKTVMVMGFEKGRVMDLSKTMGNTVRVGTVKVAQGELVKELEDMAVEPLGT